MGVKKDLARSVDVPVVRQVVIENPIINSPFGEPTRHFRFSDEGITNEIQDGRRPSSYFVPIAKPKKKGSNQLQFDTEWTRDRIEENKLVNDIRQRVALWRKGGYVGVTPTTGRLIAYWTDPTYARFPSSRISSISPTRPVFAICRRETSSRRSASCTGW